MIFGYEWNGRRLLPTRKASHEILELGLSIQEIIFVLNKGFDCASSKRQKGRVEKCFRRGTKLIRVVVQESELMYASEKEEVYWIIHVSEETYKKERWKS